MRETARNEFTGRLQSLQVRDVMNRMVVAVSPCEGVSRVALLLRDHRISGVPVLDDQRHCVGMLTLSDLVRRRLALSDSHHPSHLACFEHDTDDLVCDYMTMEVHAVEGTESLATAAQTMRDHHVHRVPVVNGSGRVIGMLTALDLVAAIANAFEESTQ